MGKTRMEELFYELYASTKQHDSWQRYAMVVELRALMKQTIRGSSGSDHFERAHNDEDLVETEVATDPIETEHGTLNLVPEAQEEKKNFENHEGLVMLEEESIPQSKVPIANSEILKSIESGKVDLGLENLEYVVMNENLEQEWVQKKVKTSYEADGDVGKGQKMISDANTCCAHKVFVKMPSKVKRIKHLKGWKFKFKPTSKRSKLMDDMFSLVEETTLLKKDPKETIWDCVKKELKETMAAYGKTRVDRFKLVDEKESRPEVVDMNQTFLYHQIGHGVDILLVPKLLVHDKEGAVLPQRSKSLTISDCSERSSRANRVWKPGGLLCVQDHSGGSSLMITQRVHGLRLQRIIYMDMKFQEVIVDDVLSIMVCLCVPNKKFEAELEIYDCKTKKHLFNVPIEDLFKETDAYFLRQEEFEQLLKTTLSIQQVMRDKKIRLSKRWWFKYRFDEEDQGSLQSRAGQRRNHGLFIRLHSKQKQRKCPKSWMFKFKTGSKLAGTSHLKRHKESGLVHKYEESERRAYSFCFLLS